MPRAVVVVGRIAWIIPAIVGLGALTWISFLYPGIKMRKRYPIWLWISIVFVALGLVEILIAASVDAGDEGDVGGIYVLIWFSGIVAFLVMLKWWIPFNPATPESSAVRDLPATEPPPATQNVPETSEQGAQTVINNATVADAQKVSIDSSNPSLSRTDEASTKSSERIPPKVFISHATEDRDSTSVLAQELEEHGIITWLAFRDVQVGDNYAEEIVKAIVSADYILVVLSESAINSPHVRREVTIGIDRGVPLLPVNMSSSEDFMWSLPVDWTYWLSLAQVLRHTDEASTAAELARRISRG